MAEVLHNQPRIVIADPIRSDFVREQHRATGGMTTRGFPFLHLMWKRETVVVITRDPAKIASHTKGRSMIKGETGQLVAELKRLRQRGALNSPNLADMIGSLLRSTMGLDVDSSPPQLREALRRELVKLAGQLPDELQLAVLTIYGLTEESATTGNFEQRLKLVAEQINRNPKTAVRRVNEALEVMARAALATHREQRTGHPGSPWCTATLHTSVVLDRGFPQVYERRRIVVPADEVEEIELEVSVPTPPIRGGEIPPESTGIEILHGGSLQVRQRRSSARLGYVLRLPHKLARHEEHEFFLHFRFTEQDSMRPFYVCTPNFPCELFDLHVKFDPEHLPNRIWQIAGLPPFEVEDEFAPREPAEADPCSEVHFTFTDLTPNRSFGVAWSKDLLGGGGTAPGT